MSTSSTTMTPPANPYTTPAVLGAPVAHGGIGAVAFFVIAYLIYGHQPPVGASADALVAFYDGGRARVLIAAIVTGMAVLNLMWFAAAVRTTGCGRRAGRLGRGRHRRQRRSRRPADPARHHRRGARRLDRPPRQRSARGRTERPGVVRRGRLLLPARNARHVERVRALARAIDLERAVRGGRRRDRPRAARRNHLAERRLLGARRPLLAVRLAPHHSAGVQDRDGAALVLDRVTRRFPFLERIFADAGYQGPRVAAAAPRPVEIIKRTDAGFVVQPKRWVIERTFAWACINRRLAETSSAPPRRFEPSSRSP